jgi:hypothetical protein
MLAAAALVVAVAPRAHAQDAEFTPFAGYRFGGDFFELVATGAVDGDGAPAIGFLLDVPLSNGLRFEGLVTHQSADVLAPAGSSHTPARWRIVVDHFQAGGLQEFANGRRRVRPFLTGLVGLSRYAAAGDDEIRFTVSAGGGVKLFPWSVVGLRLDGRVFTTFVHVDARSVACASGAGCLVALRTDVAWQAEFSAGLIVRLR